MLPQIKLRASDFGPGIKASSKKASPMVAVNKMARIMFELELALSAIGPIRIPERAQATIAPSKGSKPNSKPTIAPKKAE